MLMKLSHRPAHVSELAVYDVAHAPGVAADLSHIDTDCKVRRLRCCPSHARWRLMGELLAASGCWLLRLSLGAHGTLASLVAPLVDPAYVPHIKPLPPLPQVTGYNGLGELGDALKGSKIVIIPAGVPRKPGTLPSSHARPKPPCRRPPLMCRYLCFSSFFPGMTRDDLFNTNASIVRELIQGCAE